MNGMVGLLEKYMMPVAGKIQGQKHLTAIRDGIILVIPLVIVGSVFMIIANLPIPGYDHFMSGIFGKEWATKLQYPVTATFDIMGLVAGFGVAYRLAERYKVDAVTAGVVSLAAFLLATPHHIMFTPEGADKALDVGNVLPMALMGSQGLFVAMIIALFSTEIFRLIVQKNIVIKMPEGVPPAVAKSFMALVPGFVVITLIWLVRILLEATSFEDIHNLIDTIISAPLGAVGGSLWGMLVFVFAIQLLWCFGLHGDSIVSSVMAPILLMLMGQNHEAYVHHHELPNVVTQQFYEIFMTTGGSGITLALLVLMLFRGRSAQAKDLGKLAIGPGIFNINEPVIFGTPIVMNPLLWIPFILGPLVVCVITYLSMSLGLVHKLPGIAVPWTTPIGVSGFLATGGRISGTILELVNFAVMVLIYYPFFKIWDRQQFQQEQQTKHSEIDQSEQGTINA